MNSENSEKGGVTFSDLGFHEFNHRYISLRRRIKILTRSPRLVIFGQISNFMLIVSQSDEIKKNALNSHVFGSD